MSVHQKGNCIHSFVMNKIIALMRPMYTFLRRRTGATTIGVKITNSFALKLCLQQLKL